MGSNARAALGARAVPRLYDGQQRGACPMEAEMIDVESQSKVRTAPVLPMTTTLGPVRIGVTNRDRALAIWQDVVGLDLIREDAELLELGAGGKVLIVLELGAARPVVPH